MINELTEKIVDALCQDIPEAIRPHITVLGGSAFGWRVKLYIGTLIHSVKNLFAQANSRKKEEVPDDVREETEKEKRRQKKIRNGEQEGLSDRWREFLAGMGYYRLLRRMDLWCRKNRMVCTFMLVLYAFFLTFSIPSRGICLLAMLMLFASRTVVLQDRHGEYIHRKLGQVYIYSMLLKCLSCLLLIPPMIFRYLRQGVDTNIVLQGGMIMMGCLHLVLFFLMILPGCRRNTLLCVLSAVLGFGAAMLPASAAAMATSLLSNPLPVKVGGLLCAAGAAFAFLADRLQDIVEIGGNDLRCPSLWQTVFGIGGMLMVLTGLWLIG